MADNLLTWYERESDTLILRPIWPLEAGCAYAVVLTDRLTGEGGKAIDSPFTAVNPRDQTADLTPALYMLGRYALHRLVCLVLHDGHRDGRHGGSPRRLVR